MSEERIENEIEDEGVLVEMEGEESQASPERAKAETEKSSSDDELESYSKGVQNRIKKLTERYRNEERDREEAVRLAQSLMEENKKLKGRMQQLDSGYLNEYGQRLESQLLGAKQEYKKAYDSGDSDAMADAQLKLSNLAAEQQKYNSAKNVYQQKQRLQKTQPDQSAQVADQPQRQVQQPAPKAEPDPKAQSWAERNKWFGEDRVMTTGAFAIHQTLVEDEGFDPKADEYYTELDRRLRREFPHKFAEKKSGGGSQVASAGSSASRSTKPGRRTVKLTPSQVAIARKLNVPLEEYAKYVKE